jgi:Cu-Zn family superoxide dismutase
MIAVVELRDPAGSPVGTARLTADEDGTIRLVLHVDRLPAGTHGVHFHAVGSCQRGDSTAFASAGGHHNPLQRKHGLENPDGPHAGDLPNLVVDASGGGNLDTRTARATLRPGPATLLDSDGSSLIVHASADDQKTDPSGNSGARLACGVITKT